MIISFMEMFQKLKIARKRSKLTQAEVAEVCGVTPAAVSGWEKGPKNGGAYPKIDNLKLIAKLYRVKMSQLLDDDASIDLDPHGFSTQLAKYTLKNAPKCETAYDLVINSRDMAGARDGTVLRVVPYSDSLLDNAKMVVFRNTGGARAILLQIELNGDDVALFRANQEQTRTHYSLFDGAILGVVRGAVVDPSYWTD